MADQNGKTADESWRELPDGIARLNAGEAREVRALVAWDRSPGKSAALTALGLSTGEELDAVVVHGAPALLVDVVRTHLARLAHAGGEIELRRRRRP
jgi:hypothetical protein